VSGLPSDRFTFLGFPPPKSTARKKMLFEVKDWQSSLIIYESPHRLPMCLRDMEQVLGKDRQAAVCRELTKKFEEVTRGSLDDLVRQFADKDVKGEIVIVVDRPVVAEVKVEDVETSLRAALLTLSVKQASQVVAEQFGLPKRETYQMALKLGVADE
jgi:16S rRNA (cytidine1402-2'-O)-methyltransferase